MSSSKADRKTIEKQRRDRMKALYSNLTALISRESPTLTESNPITNQLDEATNYITKLKAKVEELKYKKSNLTGASSSTSSGSGNPPNQWLRLPEIQISMSGSTMNVELITGLHYRSMFKQVVGILNEEGAEVVHASFSVVDQTIFHTIQAQIGDGHNAIARRLAERLNIFVYHIDCKSN